MDLTPVLQVSLTGEKINYASPPLLQTLMGDVAHAAEVGEEAFEGGEMWQAVTALHFPVVILPCSHT